MRVSSDSELGTTPLNLICPKQAGLSYALFLLIVDCGLMMRINWERLLFSGSPLTNKLELKIDRRCTEKRQTPQKNSKKIHRAPDSAPVELFLSHIAHITSFKGWKQINHSPNSIDTNDNGKNETFIEIHNMHFCIPSSIN